MAIDLGTLQALCDAATPEPWSYVRRDLTTGDKAFVTAARTAMPELIAITRHTRRALRSDGFESIHAALEELRSAREIIRELQNLTKRNK